MNVETTPAPSAPATSQATAAELAALHLKEAERCLGRAVEDREAARARSQRVELATTQAVVAAAERLEVARLLARPELLALQALPKPARVALEQAADAEAAARTPEGAPKATKLLHRARALARLAGVTT